MDSNIKQEKCEFCGEMVASYNIIHISSENKSTPSCLKCYNQRLAEYSETDFDHAEFEPAVLKDTEDTEHEFHFTVRHLGDRVAIDSFEIKDGHQGGYKFGII